MANTDDDWEKWGQIDPYYAVVSHKEFRSGSLEDSKAQFFATGEAYVNGRINRLEHFFGPLPKGRALDFGSGVGRLVLPLAARFEEAVGVDISESMLAEARANADRQGITNVSFVTSDDTMSRVTDNFDFVLSFIVLQHIPISRGVPIIRQLLDRVAPNGGISLHFSVCRNDSLLKKAVYWARRNVPGANRLLNISRGIPWSEPLMQMNEYPLGQIIGIADEKGFSDIIVDVERHGNVLTATMTARRSAENDGSV